MISFMFVLGLSVTGRVRTAVTSELDTYRKKTVKNDQLWFNQIRVIQGQEFARFSNFCGDMMNTKIKNFSKPSFLTVRYP